MRYVKKHIILVSMLLAVNGYADGSKVEYPENYRGWGHVKSMVIEPGHPLADPFAGIHHIYANEKALQGYQNKKYEDGSIIVFDLLDYGHENHAFTEGKRKFIGVMHKDSKRFSATGGWGYEAFAGDSDSERVVTDGGKSCHACHASQKNQGFVFSAYRK